MLNISDKNISPLFTDQTKNDLVSKEVNESVISAIPSTDCLNIYLKGGSNIGEFVYIGDIDYDTVWIRSGNLKVGDIVLEIQGKKISGCSLDEAVVWLKQVSWNSSPFMIKTLQSEQSNDWGVGPQLNISETHKNVSNESGNTVGHFKHQTVFSPVFTNDPSELKGNLLKANLIKSVNGFGFTIVGGNGENEEFLQVKKVIPNGPCAIDGTIASGDVLVFVNDINCLGKSHSDIISLFQSIVPGSQVDFLVCRGYSQIYNTDDPNIELRTAVAVTSPPVTPLKSPALYHLPDNISSYSALTDEQFTLFNSRGVKIDDTFLQRNHSPVGSVSPNYINLPNLSGNEVINDQVDSKTSCDEHNSYSLTVNGNEWKNDMKETSMTREFLEVFVERGSKGFGFTILESSDGQKVKKIVDEERCTMLKENDILHEIDGINVKDLPHMEVARILMTCEINRPTKLIVERQKAISDIEKSQMKNSNLNENNVRTKFNMLSTSPFSNVSSSKHENFRFFDGNTSNNKPEDNNIFTAKLHNLRDDFQFSTDPQAMVVNSSARPGQFRSQTPKPGLFQNDRSFSESDHSVKNIYEKRSMTPLPYPSRNMKQNTTPADNFSAQYLNLNEVKNNFEVPYQHQSPSASSHTNVNLSDNRYEINDSNLYMPMDMNNGVLINKPSHVNRLHSKDSGFNSSNLNSHVLMDNTFNQLSNHNSSFEFAGSVSGISNHFVDPHIYSNNLESHGIDKKIYLRPTQNGFGFRIIGGTEEGSQVSVGHIVPGGAADQEGQLSTGDEIAYVNGVCVINSPHSLVVQQIQKASSLNELYLIVRSFGSNQDNNYYYERITLKRHLNEGFGFLISSNIGERGALISDIIANSPAERCGRLHVGDYVLMINEIATAELTHDQIVSIIRDAPRSITVTIAPSYDKYDLNVSTSASDHEIPSLSNTSFMSAGHIHKQPNVYDMKRSDTSSINSERLIRSDAGPRSVDDQNFPGSLYVVNIHRGLKGFGFSIRGGKEFSMPLYVLRIAEGSTVHLHSSLMVGDQILEINGHDVSDITHSEAISLIQQGGPLVTLIVKRTGILPSEITSMSPQSVNRKQDFQQSGKSSPNSPQANSSPRSLVQNYRYGNPPDTPVINFKSALKPSVGSVSNGGNQSSNGYQHNKKPDHLTFSRIQPQRHTLPDR